MAQDDSAVGVGRGGRKPRREGEEDEFGRHLPLPPRPRSSLGNGERVRVREALPIAGRTILVCDACHGRC